jgi:Ca2+-binding RTX toxin-like protein
MGGSIISAVNILNNLAGNNYLGKAVASVASDTMSFIYGAVDTLSVNSTQIDTITGIENFTSSDAAGVEYIVGTSGANAINVGAGADYVDGGAGNDTITLGADTVVDTGIGGDGQDSFVYVAHANLVATSAVIDSLNGGAGTADAIVISNNAAATFTIAAGDDLVRAVGVEVIKASGASNKIMSVTTHADANIDGFNTVDLSLDTDATSSNVINASNTTTAHAGATGFTLKGGAGIDAITGTALSDTIDGGAGVDTITGGLGGDTITTGTGDDFIVFGATGNEAGLTVATAVTVKDYTLTLAPGAGGENVGDIFDFAATTAAIGSTTSDANVASITAGKIAFVDATVGLSALIADAFTTTAAAAQLTFFVDGGNTYVATQGVGSEGLIILEGVVGTSIILNAGLTATIAADQYVIV